MTEHRPIPFVDLVTPHIELQDELVAAFRTAIRTAAFIGGPAVEGFEREFAEYCSAQHCVGVSSGTDALRFALTGAGVQPGDIVLTVPHTFIATTEAISQAGARPDFVDVDARTYTMDPMKLRHYMETKCELDGRTGRYIHRRLGKPVTAVIPVHLYGQTADMDPILELAERFELVVIEDACQAHGAEYFSKRENRWRKAGSMGHAAAFSFYPGKNLGACGEGGAITTNHEMVARSAKMLRDHGQFRKYYHEIEGYNGRLDAIQAGILSVKLRHLTDWNRRRQNAARRYDDMLSSFEEVIAPCQPEWSRSVYHLYVIRVQDREGLQKHLAEAHIHTGIHYPVALHLQPAYAHLGYKQGDFPVSEKTASEILSLPMYPQLQPNDQIRIIQTILQFLSQSANLQGLTEELASRPK
jgi:dTDP-4-amino-4,6-dideoxygalactose transaminase